LNDSRRPDELAIHDRKQVAPLQLTVSRGQRREKQGEKVIKLAVNSMGLNVDGSGFWVAGGEKERL
jgi:hypothetical protein